MRYIMYESTQHQVSLSKEVDFLKNYIEVEALRHSNKINISFETQGIRDQALIEPLLLLPFVENTFKHGIREELAAGYIHIILSLIGTELFMELKNSIPAVAINEPKGIGLQNAVRRLEILYPNRHNLDIKHDDKSYELRLTLILNNK